MIKYVCGFMMDNEGNMLLLHKQHGPPRLIGKWSGVGGKIEANESSLEAMNREFREETGYDGPVPWKPFCTLIGDTADVNEFVVQFFYAYVDKTILFHIEDCKPATDEIVRVFHEKRLPNVVPNVRWLIPMARSFDRGEQASSFGAREFYTKEVL